MNENPSNSELVERMIQACKNIIFATSGIHSPKDVAKDVFAIDNMETCMAIILESYDAINQVGKAQLGQIDWDEIKIYMQALNRQKKNEYDYKLLYRLCKIEILTLQNKLEAEFSTIK